MADTPSSLSMFTLAQTYRGDVVRQINRKAALLRFIPINSDAGKNLAWSAEADGSIAENFSEGADAANFAQDAQAPCTLNWGLYRSNIHVTELSMDAAASSHDPIGNKKLWGRHIVNSSSKLSSTINAACYSGAGTGTLLAGLDVAIGLDTNVYAGIDRSTNAYWKPTVVDPGTLTDPSFALIRDDLRKIFEASGESPQVALCAPAVFNKVAGLFDATRRQVDMVQTARGQIRLDFGYQCVEVDGTVFVKDKDATAQRIYYVNSSYVELCYLPPAEYSEMMAHPVMQLQAQDGQTALPLGFRYSPLAKLGASDRAQIVWTGQLKVTKPCSMGVRKNVKDS